MCIRAVICIHVDSDIWGPRPGIYTPTSLRSMSHLANTFLLVMADNLAVLGICSQDRKKVKVQRGHSGHRGQWLHCLQQIGHLWWPLWNPLSMCTDPELVSYLTQQMLSLSKLFYLTACKPFLWDLSIREVLQRNHSCLQNPTVYLSIVVQSH